MMKVMPIFELRGEESITDTQKPPYAGIVMHKEVFCTIVYVYINGRSFYSDRLRDD